MSQRFEFVQLARNPETPFATLCRRFGISRKTGYKWLRRAAEARSTPAGLDDSALRDRSRRPHTSPVQTPAEREACILALRDAHPAWGGRKLAAVLQAQGCPAVPAPSTITGILRRHGRLDPAEARKHTPVQRFERDAPNQLWQMDFKGHFPLGTGRCHPLTVLDDHARFALVLQACARETTDVVQEALIVAFEHYGLPEAILTDHGTPWGEGGASPYTRLSVWLMRLGIQVCHGRPAHPQTQGKDERFHRTLQAEVLHRHTFADLAACQTVFDHWRAEYNLVRPHEACALRPPSTRYQISPRPYPGDAPAIVYAPGDAVRRVQTDGRVFFRGRVGVISKAFCRQSVAIRPLGETEDRYALYFCQQRITTFTLTDWPKET